LLAERLQFFQQQIDLSPRCAMLVRPVLDAVVAQKSLLVI
jgi:hypothetical protein